MLGSELLKLAVLRRKPVEVMGQRVYVREASLLEKIEYGERNKKSQAEALGYMLHCTVQDEAGETLFTEEQAMTVIRGNDQVSAPLVNAILGFASPEKKDLAESSDSSTGSPSPSAEPSASSKPRSVKKNTLTGTATP